MTQAASAHSGNLLLLVGTKKGSFLLTGDSARRNWTLSGPYNQGAEVFHLAYDSRNGGRILAAANYMIWGPQLEFSDDLGGSWNPATQLHSRRRPYRQPDLAYRARSGQPTRRSLRWRRARRPLPVLRLRRFMD